MPEKRIDMSQSKMLKRKNKYKKKPINKDKRKNYSPKIKRNKINPKNI